MSNRANKTLMGCSIEADTVEGDVMDDDRRPTGLMTSHAYALLDVVYVKNPNHRKKRNRLLRIRNPWGQKEWTGQWGDHSEKLEGNLENVLKELEKLAPDERFDPNNDQDGTFLMCFSDWRYYFSNLFACLDFPDDWSGVRFFSEWTIQNSGGLPTRPTTEACREWAKNPQFNVELKPGRSCELFISLVQKDGRFISELEFPYEKYIRNANFVVMKAEEGEDYCDNFDPSQVLVMSVVKLHREVSLSIKNLNPGKYVIVPATLEAKSTGQFFLSIYHSCAKEDITFTARDNPDDHGNVIEEEEEIDPHSISQAEIQKMKDNLNTLMSL